LQVRPAPHSAPIATTGPLPSHAWFAGFAPFSAPPIRRIAFAVVVEGGGYGATTAAPIAGRIVEAARKLSVIP
jgi:cell division protein FtsI/penicillin-binding protein 2